MIVGRHRPVVYQLLGLVGVLPFLAGLMVFLGLGAFWPSWAAGVVWLLCLAGGMWLLVGACVQMGTGGASLSVTGSETPPGDRWMVAALAQAPGTSMTAVLLARRLVAAVPPGAVVATAGSAALLQRYLRLGFTRGRGRRIFLHVTGGSPAAGSGCG